MTKAINTPERCYYCDAPLGIYNRTIDHLIPKARGGLNQEYNRVWCCKTCNAMKMDMTVTEFMRYKELKEKYKGKQLIDKCRQENILLWSHERQVRNKKEKARREYYRKKVSNNGNT